ncbi:hypothetical protein RB614_14615 [Phytohabitans sp. ZYX-F-186]|uniref:Lipoprotein n=1 Tax=Phytohabitans maris TaxID=3071409 RepID=A0ABU0ZFB2_9ACTN|nr:hypothetical protein [Phytohabitans sp. ZYX-F-186]MDQ7905749.1 hypothetical protein [Phytohabitans sp. ZYX-F-186]
MSQPVTRRVAVALLAAAVAGCGSEPGPPAAGPTSAPPPSAGPTAAPSTAPPAPPPAASELPLGGRRIFPAYRVVAYYGTAGNPALGVLGESSPEGILPRLRGAARGYGAGGRPVQVAYELIATVAQASPGKDGRYRRTIDLARIRQYVEAARRHRLLVVLDVQPGRSDFLTEVAKLRPFLEQPHVGLALDPEWRMAAGQVPGRTIGRVSAAEVNLVSAYVAGIVRERGLPEKLFVLHQFRASMIPDITRVQARPGLAMVQHVDGFGTRAEKDATFGRLRRPGQFHIGYKLFYDEDVRMYTPREVLAFRPSPEYVSYQ